MSWRIYNADHRRINSNLDFTIVVNPANGPGDALDDNYVAGIAKLRQPNVRLLGYVPLGYGNNSINLVRQQVQTWSSWSIDSIFYDESPHVYRNIEDVLQAHAGVIEVETRLYPMGVAMAGDSVIDPFKD